METQYLGTDEDTTTVESQVHSHLYISQICLKWYLCLSDMQLNVYSADFQALVQIIPKSALAPLLQYKATMATLQTVLATHQVQSRSRDKIGLEEAVQCIKEGMPTIAIKPGDLVRLPQVLDFIIFTFYDH